MQEERTNRGTGDKLLEDVLKRQYKEGEEAARIAADNRVQVKRLLRTQQMMNEERDMQESLLRTERDRMARDQVADQEEKLAKELERRHLEEMREEKARQHIRENSQEIRELESKLKAAYTSKERAAQIAYKKNQLEKEEGKDSEMVRKMREANERAVQIEKECEERRFQDKLRYKQELERQLEQQEITRQEAYQLFLKDKLMIDEIVRKIYEEDQKELEREAEKQHRTKEYMQEFIATRDKWKKREKEKMEEENRKIQDYARLQKQREEAWSSAKQKREDDLARVQQATEVERRLRERLEQQQSYAQELYLKGLRQQQEAQEEEEFKQQMMAKLAEDERIEQMNAEKRRRKQLEHKRAVEDLLQKRRAQYAAEREQEAMERAGERRIEEERKRMVEEERRKMLKEHAMKLIGHLPRGVIQGEDDLQMLGPEFAEVYKSQCYDPFDEHLWDQHH
ncbi:hypothetical protein ACOMHN_042378 [Nucella lapillus]